MANSRAINAFSFQLPLYRFILNLGPFNQHRVERVPLDNHTTRELPTASEGSAMKIENPD